MKFLTRATTTEGFVDLHNHTDRGYCDFENGVQITPLQFLEEMYEYSEKYNKPVTFSITDHNNTEANNEIMSVIAQNPEKYKNINYIPGAEYSCSADSLGVCYAKNRSDEVVEKPIIKGNRIHLLAYGMDSKDPDILYLNTLMNDSNDYKVDLVDVFGQRNEENQDSKKVVKLGNIVFAAKKWLKNHGILVGIPEFRQNCPIIPGDFFGTYNGVAKFVKNQFNLTDEQMADFRKEVVNTNNLFHCRKADVMEVMSVVENAGGYTVLAHPAVYTPSEQFQAIWKDENTDPRNLKYKEISFDDLTYSKMAKDEKGRNYRRMGKYFDYIYRNLTIKAKDPITGKRLKGLVGHELVHPTNHKNPYKYSTLMEVGERYGLYCTAGSDSHGDLFWKRYCFPSRVVGAQVQKYDSDYNAFESVYCAERVKFAEDYLKSIQTGSRLERKVGRTARKQITILKTSRDVEKRYDLDEFLEVVYKSFERKKQDRKEGRTGPDDRSYEEATQQENNI